MVRLRLRVMLGIVISSSYTISLVQGRILQGEPTTPPNSSNSNTNPGVSNSNATNDNPVNGNSTNNTNGTFFANASQCPNLLHQQCKGDGHTGPKCCAQGLKCKLVSTSYSICVEADSNDTQVDDDCENQMFSPCGGEGFNGSTCCPSNSRCSFIDSETSICYPRGKPLSCTFAPTMRPTTKNEYFQFIAAESKIIEAETGLSQTSKFPAVLAALICGVLLSLVIVGVVIRNVKVKRALEAARKNTKSYRKRPSLRQSNTATLQTIDSKSAARLESQFGISKNSSDLRRLSVISQLNRIQDNSKLLPGAEYLIPEDEVKIVRLLARSDHTGVSVYIGEYLNAPVAVKEMKIVNMNFLSQQEVQAKFNQFLLDFQVLRYVQHPNIVQMYGILTREHSKDFSLVTELGDLNLRDALLDDQLRPLLTKDVIINIAHQVAVACSFLYRRGMAHLNLKPENVLLDDSLHHAKICDIGVATFDDIRDTITNGKGINGIASYYAPELSDRTKDRPSTKAAMYIDVYAFAFLLWEMLHSPLPCYPLDWDPYTAVVNAKLNGYRPKIDPNIPKPLAELIEECWDPIPGNRPTMDQVIRTLESINPKSSQISISSFHETTSRQNSSVLLQQFYPSSSSFDQNQEHGDDDDRAVTVNVYDHKIGFRASQSEPL